MKKIIYTFLASVLALGSTIGQTTPDILINADWSACKIGDDQTSGISGWFLDKGDAPDTLGTFKIEKSDLKLDGANTKMMHIAVPTKTTSADPQWQYSYQAVISKVNVKIDGWYRMTCWVKGAQENTKMNVTVGEYNTWTEIARIDQYLLPTTWTKLSLAFKSTRDSLRAPFHYGWVGEYYLANIKAIESHLSFCQANKTGDTISTTFGYSVGDLPATFDPSTFTIKVDGTTVGIDAVDTCKYLGVKGLSFKLTSPIPSSASSVTMSYNAPVSADDQIKFTSATVKPDNAVAIDSFANETVDISLIPSTAIPNVNLNNAVSVFPNPCVDNLTVTGLRNGNVIKVYNIAGIEVLSSVANSSIANLDVAKLAKGVYMVSVNNQTVKVLK
jgi:hypothetical protein